MFVLLKRAPPVLKILKKNMAPFSIHFSQISDDSYEDLNEPFIK